MPDGAEAAATVGGGATADPSAVRTGNECGAVIDGNGPLSCGLGFPTRGCGRAVADAGADAGSDNFGSRLESENIPLAVRGFPTFGLRIARS